MPSLAYSCAIAMRAWEATVGECARRLGITMTTRASISRHLKRRLTPPASSTRPASVPPALGSPAPFLTASDPLPPRVISAVGFPSSAPLPAPNPLAKTNLRNHLPARKLGDLLTRPTQICLRLAAAIVGVRKLAGIYFPTRPFQLTILIIKLIPVGAAVAWIGCRRSAATIVVRANSRRRPNRAKRQANGYRSILLPNQLRASFR